MTKYNATQFELFGDPVKRRETPQDQREKVYSVIDDLGEVTLEHLSRKLELPESVVTLRLRELVKEGRIRSLVVPRNDDQAKFATLWVLGNQSDYRPF